VETKKQVDALRQVLSATEIDGTEFTVHSVQALENLYKDDDFKKKKRSLEKQYQLIVSDLSVWKAVRKFITGGQRTRLPAALMTSVPA